MTYKVDHVGNKVIIKLILKLNNAFDIYYIL